MYKYSGSLYIPIFCWIISAYDFAAGIVFSVTVPEVPFGLQIQYLNEWSWLIYSLFASTAFVDVVIAATISFYLWKNRSRSMERFATSFKLVDSLTKLYLGFLGPYISLIGWSFGLYVSLHLPISKHFTYNTLETGLLTRYSFSYLTFNYGS